MEKASGRRSLQHVTLDALLALLSSTFGYIPEARGPDRVHYRLHDTLMSGFARPSSTTPGWWHFSAR
jgi:hypothetical protein